jgi:hypothetical protein
MRSPCHRPQLGSPHESIFTADCSKYAGRRQRLREGARLRSLPWGIAHQRDAQAVEATACRKRAPHDTKNAPKVTAPHLSIGCTRGMDGPFGHMRPSRRPLLSTRPPSLPRRQCSGFSGMAVDHAEEVEGRVFVEMTSCCGGPPGGCSCAGRRRGSRRIGALAPDFRPEPVAHGLRGFEQGTRACVHGLGVGEGSDEIRGENRELGAELGSECSRRESAAIPCRNPLRVRGRAPAIRARAVAAPLGRASGRR